MGVGEMVKLLVCVCLKDGTDDNGEGGGETTVVSEGDATDTQVDNIEQEAPPLAETQSPPTFLILDALNEPSKSSQSEIFILLNSLTALSSRGIRIIVTSQPTEELTFALCGWTHLELQLSFPEKMIERYVREQLEGREGEVLRGWADVEPLEFFGDDGEGQTGIVVC